MPLGIFAISFQDRVMTLSAVAFRLHYSSKSSFFDAKPAIFEAMTLSLVHIFLLLTVDKACLKASNLMSYIRGFIVL